MEGIVGGELCKLKEPEPCSLALEESSVVEWRRDELERLKMKPRLT